MEWKYARGELYIEFIQNGNTLPYPFNIVPSPKSIFKVYMSLVKTLCCWICQRDKKEDYEKEGSTVNNDEVTKTRNFRVHNALAKPENLQTIPRSGSVVKTCLAHSYLCYYHNLIILCPPLLAIGISQNYNTIKDISTHRKREQSHN